VLEYDETEHKTPGAFWICKCTACNKTIRSVKGANLLKGVTTNCGCIYNKIRSEKQIKDLTGMTFGRLKVIKLDHIEPGRNGGAYWLCECSCKNHTICVKRGTRLRNGQVQSCGCLSKEIKAAMGKASSTHNISRSRIAHIHAGMISRCYRKTDRNYPLYGAAGIRVCSEWYNPDLHGWNLRREGNTGLLNFTDWAYSHGYYDQPKDTPFKDMLSIERKDITKDYCPDNCIWIPAWQQASNKRTTQLIYDGEETITFAQFSRKYNLDENFAHNRIVVSNWTPAATLFAAKHPELKMHKDRDGKYRDCDGFEHMIPRIK
jgi:hypothetical protein